MVAAALKRCYDKQTHFRKKISVEEQRVQKDNRFSQRETKLLIRSTNTFAQLDPLTRFKAYRASKWRTTTFRTLIYVGSKHYC